MKKATGIVRRVDDLGRVVIPKELRRTMEINDGDPLEIFTTGDEIVLRKYRAVGSCTLCGSVDQRMLEISPSARVCAPCGQRIIEAARVSANG